VPGECEKRWESRTDSAPRLVAGQARRALGKALRNNVQFCRRVAFFAFLALFPRLIAALTLYGMVADPDHVAQQKSAEPVVLYPPGAGSSVNK